MTSAQAALAAYLTKTYPNLSTNDIIQLLASGLTIADLDEYLSHLCGGLSGIAQLIIDSATGDTNAQNLLNKIIELGDAGKDGDVGAQRVMGVLNKLGVNNVRDLEVPIPDPANPGTHPGQLPKADIVLKDGTAIEVGGPRKAEEDGVHFRNQVRTLIREYGADKVEVYLEDNRKSSGRTRKAQKYAIDEIASALSGDGAKATSQVHVFSSSDRLCI